MDKLGYVFEAIKVTKRDLNNRVPLIGLLALHGHFFVI